MKSKMMRSLFSRILCPIEFDGESLGALRLGRVLAERNGSVLSLIHVMTPATPGGVVLREDREKAKGSLEKIAESELAGVDYEVIVCWGNPVKEIIAAETKLGAELCVMATDGHMGASHLFMRSIAEKVARNSFCPVLMVGHRSSASARPDASTISTFI